MGPCRRHSPKAVRLRAPAAPPSPLEREHSRGQGPGQGLAGQQQVSSCLGAGGASGGVDCIPLIDRLIGSGLDVLLYINGRADQAILTALPPFHCYPST